FSQLAVTADVGLQSRLSDRSEDVDHGLDEISHALTCRFGIDARLSGFIDPNTVFATGDTEKTPILQLIQSLRGRFRKTAPGINHTVSTKMALQFSGMNRAKFRHDAQNLAFQRREALGVSRVNPSPDFSGEKTICIQIIFLDIQRRIPTLQISGA